MDYKIGDRVKMTEDALENYGQELEGMIFVIESAAHSYMPASEFYDKGRPEGYHPGYDDTVKGQGLYDLKGLGCSLYDWELEPA